MSNLRTLLLLALTATTLGVSPKAHAVLGEKLDSVKKVRASLNNAKQLSISSVSNQYTIEAVVSNGTTVREYINSDGVIFAVAWKGVLEPDLPTLFGDYNAEYEVAQKSVARNETSRRLVNLKTSNLSVIRQGHMRAWHGMAYIPAATPSAVSTDDLSF